MNCKKVEKELMFYLKKELSTRKIMLLEKHLEKCSRCATEKKKLLQVRSQLKTYPDIEPAEYLVQNLKIRIKTEIFDQKKSESIWYDILKEIRPVLLPSSGAIATVLLVIIMFGHQLGILPSEKQKQLMFLQEMSWSILKEMDHIKQSMESQNILSENYLLHTQNILRKTMNIQPDGIIEKLNLEKIKEEIKQTNLIKETCRLAIVMPETKQFYLLYGLLENIAEIEF